MKGNLLSEGMSEFHAGSQEFPAGILVPPQPIHLPLPALFSKTVLGTGLRVAGTMNAGLILVCLGQIGVKKFYVFIDTQLIYRS